MLLPVMGLFSRDERPNCQGIVKALVNKREAQGRFSEDEKSANVFAKAYNESRIVGLQGPYILDSSWVG
jgi:hypothetical protein